MFFWFLPCVRHEMSVNNDVGRSQLHLFQLVENKIHGLTETGNCSFVIFVLSVASYDVFSHIQIMVIPGNISILKQFNIENIFKWVQLP